MVNAMDAADLKVFEAVARTGAMNKAALALNTVQSNVTARIKALEAELGAALFERSHRGVALTPAGERLLPYALRVASLLDDARRAVADEGAPSGPLVIGSLETTAALRLSPVLAEFAAAHPAVDLSLRTGTSGELVEQVLERRLDGAFVCGPVRHRDLVVEPFFGEELVLLCAPGVADFDALAAAGEVKIVVLKAGCSYRQHLEALLVRLGIVGVRVLEFGTLEAIFGCVAAGLGVTLLPRALIGAVWQEGRVAVLPLPGGEGQVETVFIRHRHAYVSSALRTFLDLARPALADRLAAE
jgi:DNA-binding transcriptional LysR family regulator